MADPSIQSKFLMNCLALEAVCGGTLWVQQEEKLCSNFEGTQKEITVYWI